MATYLRYAKAFQITCLSLVCGLASVPSLASEVRVLEPAARSYTGALDFIESNARLEANCVKVGQIVFRNAPFSASTIERMRQRALSMGADTLLIQDTTIGPVNRDYVIRMNAYRCETMAES